MGKLDISEASLSLPEYRIVMVTAGGERIVGKMSLDKDGNIDSSMMYETINIISTLLPTEKGLMQFLTSNEGGAVMFIPDIAIITVLSRGSQYYKEYLRATSGIIEAPKSPILVK